jgi:hypothetical protein
MKKQFYTLLVMGSLFFIIGCQKESDNTTTPAPTKTELITKSSWSFDKATSGGIDISGSVPACYKDNVVTFTSATNGTVANTIVCTPTDNTPPTFTWSWQNSETIVRLSAPLFPGGTGDFNLISLTATALVVEQTVNFGAPTSVTFYYKH